MKYLTLDDLKTDSFERFIKESTQDFTISIDKAEKRAIGKVKPYLRDRYDVEAIFDPDTPLRNELLVEILVALVLSKIHGRNSARKFNKDDVDDAMKELDKIASGKITLELPFPMDDNGNVENTSMWGNLRNDNFYI